MNGPIRCSNDREVRSFRVNGRRQDVERRREPQIKEILVHDAWFCTRRQWPASILHTVVMRPLCSMERSVSNRHVIRAAVQPTPSDSHASLSDSSRMKRPDPARWVHQMPRISSGLADRSKRND